MTEVVFAALGLMLVLEGILPFAFPRVWREAFKRFTEMSDGQIRFAGLTSMLIGLILFLLVW